MQDRSDTGQDRCRTGGCRTGHLEYRTDAGQKGCRTDQIQNRTDAGQEDSSFRTGQMQDISAAGHNGSIECMTGQMQDRSDTG